jgi:glutamate/tyrosine decarboxylase-like PLP-dependent enzyme
MFCSENPLGPAAFPSLKKLEAEVVQMILSILGNDESTVGTMTSGGTESIMLSVKAHRDYFRALKPDLKDPEMIIPVSAHPAFLKAAQYCDVAPVVVPVGLDYKADPEEIGRACNERTIMIVASAPSFPQGVVDPIPDLGAIAVSLGVGLHVDACLGGFFLPFLRKLGHDVPDFDFSVPGVTAISADLHKYGFAAKGASAILYRNAEYRRRQFFVSTEWPGGLYSSPAMLGTRPGGLIAAAWSALMSLGEAGYLALVEKTMDGTKKIIRGINAIPGLEIVGKPDMSVFSFTSTRENIFGIADRMEGKRWWMNRQDNPASLHMIVTPNHLQAIDDFLKDLKESVMEEHENPSVLASEDRNIIYGGKTGGNNECMDAKDTREYLFQNLEQNYQL